MPPFCKIYFAMSENAPPEVLAELRKCSGDYSRMIGILRNFADAEKPKINDPVKILEVDLHQYDQLGLGKEVNTYERTAN